MTRFAVDAPSGVRLVLRTDATAIEIDAAPTTLRFVSSGYREPALDLVIDDTLVASDSRPGGVVVDVDPVDPMQSTSTGHGPVTFRFDDLEPTGSGRPSRPGPPDSTSPTSDSPDPATSTSSRPATSATCRPT